jgi:SAM-dependent methyltransferase
VGLLTPERRRGHEILDDPRVSASDRIRSISDVTRSNRIFGGLHAALSAIDPVLARGARLSLLDVGTGLADIPVAIRARAESRGVDIMAIGLDEAPDLLGQARGRVATVCGSAGRLPFRDHSIDVVVWSQLLHHFSDDELVPILTELNRVARRLVVIADLRRSWLAAAGFWIASFPLRFHPITRHDGVVSVLRGFTAEELRRVIAASTGVRASVQRRIGFRLTATWVPQS